MEGITFSAYGEGEKPIVRGCPIDGGDAADWVLYSEKDGAKIWKYFEDIGDIGGIYFNNCESYAERIYGWWRNGHYVNMTLTRTEDCWKADTSDTEMTPENALIKDLTFCHMSDLSDYGDYPIDPYMSEGPLYLRCDAGNPAQVYDTVDFAGGYDNPVDMKSNTCLDNICIKFSLQYAVGVDITQKIENTVVQDCEIAYGGNAIIRYDSIEPLAYNMSFMFGDGIYGLCKNAVIRGNYIHDIDCVSISFENVTVSGGSYVCEGNVIERCGNGIGLNDFEYDSPKTELDTVNVKNNIVLDLYRGWVHSGLCDGYCLSLLVKGTSVKVTDNIFWGSPDEIFDCYPCGERKSYEFSGNIYGQYEDRMFIFPQYTPYYGVAMKNSEIQSIIKTYLGDANPEIYVIPSE